MLFGNPFNIVGDAVHWKQERSLDWSRKIMAAEHYIRVPLEILSKGNYMYLSMTII